MAIRALRILRIFKLAKNWEKFRDLLFTIGKTVQNIKWFSLLLFIIMYSYSILGM